MPFMIFERAKQERFMSAPCIVQFWVRSHGVWCFQVTQGDGETPILRLAESKYTKGSS